jgi:polyhydroxybutyrate depolymerase
MGAVLMNASRGWLGAAGLAAWLTTGVAAAPDDMPDFVGSMPPPAEWPAGAQGPFIDVGRGPIPVKVPEGYDPETPTPLIVLLHGYTSSGASVEAWMQFTPRADEYGFLFLAPDGTRDCFGQRFWNATDGCCNLCDRDTDDSGYLRDVVDEMKAQYNVDARRVYFVGHSNGGFMSYRMACDHADTVAAIASLAGATYIDPADCAPSVPVDILQIHGTADGVISYDGGCIPLAGCYPGAVQTVETWATYDGCSLDPVEDPDPLDLDADQPGAETTVFRYESACEPGGSAQLWSIQGGPHSPNLTSDFTPLVVEYLLAHPKPVACREDVDGSGAVDFDDLLRVLAAWGPCEACPEDIDGNGVVGFPDLLRVLSGWGPCPA